MDPQFGYAKSEGGIQIAYAVLGDGETDLVFAPGMVSHLELYHSPPASYFFERLSTLGRVITFDKRGTGLSDPVTEVPTLEVRMEDLKAVMDAAGSERPVIVGLSEGGSTALLFAATYPERVSSLVLYGATARTTWAPDYPWPNTKEAMLESAVELITPYWGQGAILETTAPSLADDPEARAWWARLERMGTSPAMLAFLYAMYLDVDVRGILPLVRTPTLVLHRRGDRTVNVRNARWLAEQLPNAHYVELEGIDHAPIADPDQILDEIELFVTGRPAPVDADRVLATVMFTDLVSSTARAAEVGDKRWREVLQKQQQIVRAQLARFRGVEIKTTGDGFLATFDGPVRAIRCGRAIIDEVGQAGLEIRVGLHTGEIERMGGDVGGIAVHIASRVGALAGAAEVLVSETVKGIVAGSGIVFADRGTHTLKGVPDEWRLFSVES
jgi:pimeloyl-ACP methyl ester carboxylesterase